MHAVNHRAACHAHQHHCSNVLELIPGFHSNSSVVRKSIARVLTVVNQKTRQNLRELYKGKKLPLDLRAKKTRAIRRRLTKHERTLTTEKSKKVATHFPKRRYAVKVRRAVPLRLRGCGELEFGCKGAPCRVSARQRRVEPDECGQLTLPHRRPKRIVSEIGYVSVRASTGWEQDRGEAGATSACSRARAGLRVL